ncbi:uncharacterized protein TRIVIDRAFT_54746 [Trichoderma virens Gv29-8]|uniref:F-box domain-containing protein n=1 Tax=Hypocrea virens (strain Gv29-8 / FGSC 10586) TaxID=413071 RepID=G9MIA5_HYPVG|nr:uncharacterized protein TRIVIDRAFT_54746 [Trichoderma virens Gv29-8]EHK25222.1 hypothetical protein TRIVIDRAFT_54746 [Trichoderma virens Gv29-8]UKZ48953.1 hypothetical protein TrVGV298_003190 [Trichoderma virens]
MASSGRSSRWDELPDEIVLQILSYLDPLHITRLQLVSRKLQKLCLDDELWKRRCFEESPWYQYLKNRRRLFSSSESEGETRDGAALGNPEAAGNTNADDQKTTTDGEKSSVEPGKPQRRSQRWQELQDMANWDPTFPNERVSWYSEYIQRNGPTCVNWLETPRIRDRGYEAMMEARGLELYYPYDGNDGVGAMLAVSPLDDGSICLWDVKGTRGKAGSILATSKSDILFIDGPGSINTRRSKRVDTGVTECVSVDNHRHRAYFAVQSHLIEIDLERLEVVSRESFEWSITALSKIQNDVPLTVGTSLGIHLHDFRARARVTQTAVEQVDQNDIFKSIFDPTPLLPYASLSQPTPVSIIHLPIRGSPDLVSNDIYVGGRFSNILHYDRRKFPVIMDSIYSGATINSMAAMPHPFSSLDSEVRRHGELSTEQVTKSKENGEGWTLIAGGTYKSKGSLEIFGLTQAIADPIVFSDGAGSIKWFERDGLTECRRLRIGHCEGDDAPSLFASMSAAGELARKIVSTKSREGPDRPNDDNVLFWTGERLGLISFTPTPLYQSKDFDEEPDIDAAAEEEERRRYAEQLREALDWHADEVRFMNTFGHGGLGE